MAEIDEFKQDPNAINVKEWLKCEGGYVMRKAIAEFGADHQKGVAIEEQSELIKEICKDLRGIGIRKNVVEEIADVEIMLYQLKQIYQVTENELEVAKYGKLRRLEGRVQDHMLARIKELENGKRT